ncbi:Heavy metal-associated isoprenylated plant protein 23, partial [Bienertia sinuspersici]
MMGGGHNKHMKKRKQFQTVELKVRMDCDGCELKVKKTLSSLSGVKSVEITGNSRRRNQQGRRAEFWPYVPYNLVAQPYSSISYDKKAPPGHVRKVDFVASPKIGTIRRFDYDQDLLFQCSVMKIRMH